MTAQTPAGTRLILASENILEQFGTRTDNGWAITAEWGEPRPEGWYEPVFTTTDDGSVLLSPAEAARYRAIEEAAQDVADGRHIAVDGETRDEWCFFCDAMTGHEQWCGWVALRTALGASR